MTEPFHRRVLLSLDAQAYGSRGDHQQLELQRALTQVVAEAAGRAGVDLAAADRQAAGDGMLIILAPGSSEVAPVDAFPRELVRALRDYNGGDRGDSPRLRLRLAVHQGLVATGDNGYPGAGVVVVARMVDSGPARAALKAASAADLVLLVSRTIYFDLVVQSHTSVQPQAFRQVEYETKEGAEVAWLSVPGGDAHALDLSGESSDASGAGHAGTAAEIPASVDAAAPTKARVVVNGGVHGGNVVQGTLHGTAFNFGIQTGDRHDG
ncbi:hypothetical protein UO65_5237 [Actinokineospora spheciospongiae]|uniref:Guanylate cyclase domain-containing protein n=1 Tax=Actinokineospora spheciospongiae TaxID=909613 RepID=W7IZK8_9PSEU|nr:hypothetical protein [Actinokineospora spheciospongiae]EWC59509.1 hypothetical protein UO65_5237 [Actinokineospora spheciospongiae]